MKTGELQQHSANDQVAVAVFSKTPELTPVKTRLAASIGSQAALAFYELSVSALSGVLDAHCRQSQIRTAVWWALAEASGPEQPRWSDRQALWTGDGCLGSRLHQVSEALLRRADSVLLIGTDSPQMTPEHLLRASRHLLGGRASAGEKRVVYGPCADGGFYLFGSNFDLGPDLWRSVAYSAADTLEQLRKAVQSAHPQAEAIELESLSDVDHYADLKHMATALGRLRAPNPAQVQLMSWLENTVSEFSDKPWDL